MSAPFEPDGAYAGVPYKARDDGSVDALMQGAVVRFRDVDHMMAVLNGEPLATSSPAIPFDSTSATLAQPKGSNAPAIVLTIVGIGAVVAFVAFGLIAHNAEDMWVSAVKGLAEVKVKIELRDVNARFDNVAFHPIEGPGQYGNSYTCGYVTPSYNTRAPAKRFLHIHKSEATSIEGMDRALDQQINSICDRAPLPIAIFDISGGEVRLKNRSP